MENSVLWEYVYKSVSTDYVFDYAVMICCHESCF